MRFRLNRDLKKLNLFSLTEVALRGRRRANVVGLVGLGDVHRPSVGVGEDGHCFDSQPTGGADDATGNLAAVGNQQATDGLSGDGGVNVNQLI